ncbi:F-box protein At2g05970-like [Rosa chinensis]|uniref:F-box protein At2g05970-like n=1 Tax=Rosa chinensis TaxID=74649 RepID=UPI000D092E55|nr:F-box protein At2g05970-like [Rosa chinensis]
MSIQKHRRSNEHDYNQGSKLLKQVPDEIMELILQRLNIFDYLAFRQVCRSWHAISKRCSPAPQLPWLLFDSDPFHIQDHCLVSCLSDPRTHYSVPPKLFYESRCLGSVEGWLIMAARIHRSSPVVNLLLNPISGCRVELPPLSTISGPRSTRLDFLRKAVASFEQTRLEQCLVASLCDAGRLAFCRNIDESWTLVKARERNVVLRFEDVEIIDGKLYAATTHSTLMVFNIQGVTYTAERVVKLPYFGIYYHTGPYIAKDVATKDLFIVYSRSIASSNHSIIVYDLPSRTRYHTRAFRVFKLECDNSDDPHCVEVFDLGNRTLFVNDLGTKIISSSSDLERNCIYYALYRDYTKESKTDFGVFSLTNKSIKLLTFPGYASLQGFFKGMLVWFTPNPW